MITALAGVTAAVLGLTAVPAAAGAGGERSGGPAVPKGGGFRDDPAVKGRPGAQRTYKRLGTQARRAAAPAHKITINALDRHGRAPATSEAPEAYFISLDGREWLSAPLENGTATGELPEGDYIVQAYVDTPDDSGVRSNTLVYISRYSHRADGVLVLDARKGRPLSAVITDRPDARLHGGVASIGQRVGDEIITDLAGVRAPHAYLTPAEPAPGLTTRVQAQLTRNGAETGSPYLYSVAREFQGIPADPVVRTRTADLAAVHTRHTAPGAGTCAGTNRGANFGSGMIFLGYTGIGALPAVRTEYFTPGVDWSVDEGVTTTGCDWEAQPPEITARTERFARPGSYTRVWNNAPLGPSPGYFRWNPGGEPGGEPDIAVPMLASYGTRSSLARYVQYLTGGTTVRDAGGEVVAATNLPGVGSVLSEPRAGRHTLVAEARHRAPWTQLSARQRVAWTFESPSAPLEIAELPAVRYDIPLDDHNTGRAGDAQPVVLSVETYAADAAVPAKVRSLSFSVSTDEGVTWRPVPVRQAGDRWTATVHNPEGGFVSFRATARTTDDTTVDQSVIHAYGVR